jgi:hypothetical protein
MEAELSGRDWKRIEAELDETRPKTSETNGAVVDQVLGPAVQLDEAAVLRHIADALRWKELDND